MTTPESQAVPCTHCGRLAGDYAGGYAAVDGAVVCHPNEAGRPDCFRMITVYGHSISSCERCSDAPWEPLTDAEIYASILASIEQTHQMVADLYPFGLGLSR